MGARCGGRREGVGKHVFERLGRWEGRRTSLRAVQLRSERVPDAGRAWGSGGRASRATSASHSHHNAQTLKNTKNLSEGSPRARAQTLSLPGRLRFLPFRARLFVAAHQEHGLGHAAERTRDALRKASGIGCEADARFLRMTGLTQESCVRILEEIKGYYSCRRRRRAATCLGLLVPACSSK